MPDSHIDHKVTSLNTLWVIVQSTVRKDFSRHVSDAVFSVHTLRKLGVPKDNILVFTNDNLIVATASTLDDHNVESHVFPLSQIANVLSSFKGSVETSIMVVGGHGSLRGIHVAGNHFITPTDLLSSLRSVPRIKYGALILCQCYAGIFNYVNARQTPELFVMAGTNLKLSLSLNIQLQNPLKSKSGTNDIARWNANPFQYYFFQWLSRPFDVDGNGHCNIIDAYKFSSSLTNEKTIETKGRLQVVLANEIAEHRKLSNKWIKTKKVKENIKELEDFINNVPQNLYNVESPWLLNPIFGQYLIF